jgi:hypothetical protein
MSTIAATNLKNASAGNNNIVLNTDGTIGGTCLTQTCRAWVNFNGTGTVAIRASYNVSSITDNGVGNYTVSFTTAMTDTNYAWSIGGWNNGGGNGGWNSAGTGAASSYPSGVATGSMQMACFNSGGVSQDQEAVSLAIFR